MRPEDSVLYTCIDPAGEAATHVFTYEYSSKIINDAHNYTLCCRKSRSASYSVALHSPLMALYSSMHSPDVADVDVIYVYNYNVYVSCIAW